jgi:CxxC-x17-CxxC domain-containing protein
VGGGERAPREMHRVICAECGTETEVPFLPKNDRPVYCSSCYDKVRVRR